MLYKRLERGRRPETDQDDAERGTSRSVKRRRRGTRFTILSFLVMGLCLVFIKVSNPGADMRAPVLMLVTIGLACAVMSYVAGRM